MQTRTRNPFTTIHTEGALLPSDLLQRVLENDSSLPGLSPEGYHLSGEKLNEAINRSWNRLQGAWAAFRASRSRLNAGDPLSGAGSGTTLTRERWLLPLFDELDYGRLQTAKAVEIEGKSYPISHAWTNVPIHLVGCGVDLERRSAGVAGASKASPHSLMQEFLNRSPEAQWGLVSNGLRLRVLRDNASLTRQAFLEFDLEAMFEGEVYSDFALLWLVCHQSRFENQGIGNSESGVGSSNSPFPIHDCLLEQWSKTAQEHGTRALEQLREGVQKAIEALGQGFLRAPANQKLRADLRSGALSTQDYYRQLLRLVYRLIFLFVAEDRDLLFDPQSSPEARGRYLRHYALGRLRRLAERSRGGRHPDLYEALKVVTRLLGGVENQGIGNRQLGVDATAHSLFPTPQNSHSPFPIPQNPHSLFPNPLGLPVLGGFLFAGEALPDLESAELENESLLSAIRHLTLMEEGRNRRAVDYKNLGARELGSVYESLLELHPLINADAATFELNAVAGSERKTTGSFYTPEELIAVLLDSALEPVINQAIGNGELGVESQGTGSRKSGVEATAHSLLPTPGAAEQALLALKICDPACGSGHFLLAAARRLARRLAQLRTGEGEPPPEALRAALREVISQCIYGVDLNPMSVELCKVSLWMEALEPGKPLSFLDAHIQCGDSLVGVPPLGGNRQSGVEATAHSLFPTPQDSPFPTPLEIPDEAFNPAFGDDKATAAALKKRNKAERGGQMGLDVFVIRDQEDLAAWMARQAQEMDALPEETAEQVGQKAQTYREYLDSPQYRRRKQEYDLWTAAFFWKMEAQPGSAGILAPTQEMLRRQRSGGTLPPELVRRVEELATRLRFFHWELAFPTVFGGVGNRQSGVEATAHSLLPTAQISRSPGFDCVLGNPPWERIKLQEEEFFAQRDPEIATALNKAARQKLIDALIHSNPALAAAFEDAKHAADAVAKFVHTSERFPLTAVGDVNTYALFAELVRNVLSKDGIAGIIVPTGIATDDITKDFFSDLMLKNSLKQLDGFENEAFIFPGVHHSFRFCAITLTKGAKESQKPKFVFFCRYFQHLSQAERHFSITYSDLLVLNPNTKTLPVFRTRIDAELTQDIYSRFPVLVNEAKSQNFWEASIYRAIDVYRFAGNLKSKDFLEKNKGQLEGNIFYLSEADYLPVYESKLLKHYDHRFATYEGQSEKLIRDGYPRELSNDEKQNPQLHTIPRNWILKSDVERLLSEKTKRKWLVAFRDVTSAISERSGICAVLPFIGTDYSIRLFFSDQPAEFISSFVANLNSLVCDYVIRQKLAGNHLSDYVMQQIPVLPPDAYTPADIAYIAPRVLELVYTAYDLRPFAEDLWGVGNRELGVENQGMGNQGVGSSEKGIGNSEVGSSSTAHSLFPTPENAPLPTPENAPLPTPEIAHRELFIKQWEQNHGQSIHTILPRLESLARSHKSGGNVLSADQNLPEGRTVRHDQPDTPGGSISTGEHRGGLRAGTPAGIHSLSTNRAGVTEGSGDSPDTFDPSRTYDERVYRAIADAMRDGWQNPERLDSLVTTLITTANSPLPLTPFRWDDPSTGSGRRAQLRAELDAYYARLYGLTRDELRYILDPKEVHGEDFPGETFRVLKDKEMRLYGEYRTRRLVLEAWDKLEGSGEWAVGNREMPRIDTPTAYSPLPTLEPQPTDHSSQQPMLSDFGLYKCVQCGKMVMGYEKEGHVRDGHGGVDVEWKRLK